MSMLMPRLKIKCFLGAQMYNQISWSEKKWVKMKKTKNNLDCRWNGSLEL